MEDKLNNPQAFPQQMIYSEDGKTVHVGEGMTLRDYFAAKALVGLMSTEKMIVDTIKHSTPEMNNAAILAQDAYRLADAMLKEREK